jgi:hypothetical protein
MSVLDNAFGLPRRVPVRINGGTQRMDCAYFGKPLVKSELCVTIRVSDPEPKFR